ncbi:MAG: tRNA lysidine(34) synthetase TilS [Ruminococcus sp.]|nr:tRNA lysidine(34) synthetase TilS [Ruminococcus sp.]
MKHKMLKAVSDFSLIESGDNIVVALSGGADSVALLNMLNSVKELYNITLYACHLNHNIRGEEAQRDEDFVRELCKKLDIELFVKSVDVPALSAKRKQSLELCGREVRYEFFEELSIKLSAKVATAHTASDNVETVLYNLTRGSSLNGLCGIKSKRDYIIRPLIYATRDDVERYCEINSLSFVTDSTNLSDDYTRNNIRHNAVVALKSVNAELEATVTRMCSSLSDIQNYLDKISLEEINKSKTEYGYDCKKLLQLDSAVLKNAVVLIAKNSGVQLSFRLVELIAEAMKNSGSVDLGEKKRAVCKQGFLRIVDIDAECEDFSETPFLSCGYAEYISNEELKNINKKLLNNCINCDIITDSTVLRTRRDGDTFTLKNRDVTKSLKKLLNELKIPAEKRSSLKLIANGSTVLWLEGVGASKQGSVNEHCSGAYLITGGYYD